MSDDVLLEAITAIIRSVTIGSSGDSTNLPVFQSSLFHTNELQVKLPGCESAAKSALENELASLLYKTHQLDLGRKRCRTHTWPDLSDGALVAKSTLGDASDSPMQSLKDSPSRSTVSSPDDPESVVDYWLRGPPHIQPTIDREPFVEYPAAYREQNGFYSKSFEYGWLREPPFPTAEMERIGVLEEELKKHKQTNEAFQKALREIGEIITAVARGDLSKKVQIHSDEVDSGISEFKCTINTMLDQLQVFSSEVSRVAWEVGTKGILGGQAQIMGIDGTWKDLTNNVNVMAQNLTSQVREIASVMTAVATAT